MDLTGDGFGYGRTSISARAVSVSINLEPHPPPGVASSAPPVAHRIHNPQAKATFGPPLGRVNDRGAGGRRRLLDIDADASLLHDDEEPMLSLGPHPECRTAFETSSVVANRTVSAADSIAVPFNHPSTE